MSCCSGRILLHATDCHASTYSTRSSHDQHHFGVMEVTQWRVLVVCIWLIVSPGPHWPIFQDVKRFSQLIFPQTCKLNQADIADLFVSEPRVRPSCSAVSHFLLGH